MAILFAQIVSWRNYEVWADFHLEMAVSSLSPSSQSLPVVASSRKLARVQIDLRLERCLYSNFLCKFHELTLRTFAFPLVFASCWCQFTDVLCSLRTEHVFRQLSSNSRFLFRRNPRFHLKATPRTSGNFDYWKVQGLGCQYVSGTRVKTWKRQVARSGF